MASQESRYGKFAVPAALGAGIGALILALSLWAGLALLRSSYFVEWLSAAAAIFCLLLAWLLFLREDGLMGGKAKPMRRARIVLVSAALFLMLSTVVLYFALGFGASI